MQSDHDQDIVSAKYQGIVWRYQKWPSQDCDEMNRRRQCYLRECPPNNRRSLDDMEPFDGCCAKTQILLQGEELVVDRFQFDLTYLAVDAEQRSFKVLNAVAGLAEEFCQLIGWHS